MGRLHGPAGFGIIRAITTKLNIVLPKKTENKKEAKYGLKTQAKDGN
jgi:hypothetical protein